MRKIIWSLIAYAAWQWLSKPSKQNRRVRAAERYEPGGRAHRG